jgi:Zn-dependent membrane protease YugP
MGKGEFDMVYLIACGLAFGLALLFWGVVFGSLKMMIFGIALMYIPILLDRIISIVADFRVTKLKQKYEAKKKNER